MNIGQIVYSIKGHDKGGPYVVIKLDGDFAFIADGKLRRVEKPKKKKLKHLNATNSVAELDLIENHTVRKILKSYII